MKFKITLVFCLAVNFVFAQYVQLSDSAYNKYKRGKYALAATLFEKAIALDNQCFNWQMGELADCYIKLHNMEKAKAMLQKAVDCDAVSFTQKEYCWDLAEIYLKEKNYDKAIALYKLYDTKWLHVKHMADQNNFLLNYREMLSVAKCYEGLNRVDTAIKLLAPYVFINYSALQSYIWAGPKKLTRGDSLKYDAICRNYVSLLKKKYSNKQIKDELKKADDGFYFKEIWSRNEKDPIDINTISDTSFVWRNTTGGFIFLETDVAYFEWGEGSERKSLMAHREPFANKEYQLNKFRTSQLYRMITALPVK